eukprot:3667408-Rhodomonas_salina.2
MTMWVSFASVHAGRCPMRDDDTDIFAAWSEREVQARERTEDLRQAARRYPPRRPQGCFKYMLKCVDIVCKKCRHRLRNALISVTTWVDIDIGMG